MSNALQVSSGESVAELTGLGLTGYEAKAYLALVRGPARAADVARLAGLPRQRVYDVLESLVGRGLASVRPGRVAEFTAVAPELAVDRLLADRRQQLAASEETGGALVRLLRPVYDLGAGAKQGDPLQCVELLQGPSALAERLAELQASAERELLAFAKAQYARLLQETAPARPSKQGFRTRTVYELTGAADPAVEVMDAPHEVRLVPELPLPLVVVDGAVAVYSLDDPLGRRSNPTTVVVEHPAKARLCRVAFEAVWEQGRAPDEVGRGRANNEIHDRRRTSSRTGGRPWRSASP